MRVLRKWMLVLSLAFAPLPAVGQTCGGFVDVSPTDFFCNDVEWIGNRAVTLGCTATPGGYCPDFPVLRSQMAAFMRRLGDALKPTIQRTQDTAFDGTYEPNAVGCVSADFPVNNYPRQASFAATLYNFNAASTKSVQGELVYSTDAGANWQTTGDIVVWHTINPGETSTLPLVGGPLNLNVGSTYRFAIRAITNAPMVGIFGECQLNVRIESRTETSTPF
jgi:hypothetical protein